MAEVRRHLVPGPPSPLSFARRALRLAIVLGCAVCLFVATGGAGCDEKKTIRDEEDLLEALIDSATDFNKFLKWQAYDRMAAYIDPEEREEFLLALDSLEGRIQLEDFQISHAVVLPQDPNAPDKKEPIRKQNRDGRVVVKLINATFLPSTQVITVRVSQDWHFTNETWYARVDLREMLE